MERDLNKIAKEIYEANKAKGFHDIENSDAHYLMLVITELSEAVEADRKNKRADVKHFICFEDFTRPSHDVFSFESTIKDTVEDELADAAIRLLDLAGLRGVQLTEIANLAPDEYKIPFCEAVYEIIVNLTNMNRYSVIGYVITHTLNQIFRLARDHSIDLWWHIEQKLKYNKTRPERHGKKY